MDDRIERELDSTHSFLCQWFAGRCPQTEAYVAAHFVGRLDPGFQMVDPTGDIIDVARFAQELWSAYGVAADFELDFDDLRVRLGDGDIVIASFNEWQRNSVRLSPAAANGRIATAVFRADDAAENGLRWVHVHETWLPESAVRKRFAGPRGPEP